MKNHCRKVTRKIERWLELSALEKDAVKHHTKQCARCSRELASIAPVLDALDRSAIAYNQISYAGPMPSLPEPKPTPSGRWLQAPRVGWATALAATVVFLIWYGSNPPVPQKKATQPSMVEALRIPAMPSRIQANISMPMSPGALGKHIPKPQLPIGKSLQGRIRMPKKPEPPDRVPQKHISRREQYRTLVS